MILYSCNRLSCREVRSALQDALCDDACATLSPGRVFRMCGRRVRCGDCRPLVRRTIDEQAAHIANINQSALTLEERPHEGK